MNDKPSPPSDQPSAVYGWRKGSDGRWYPPSLTVPEEPAAPPPPAKTSVVATVFVSSVVVIALSLIIFGGGDEAVDNDEGAATATLEITALAGPVIFGGGDEAVDNDEGAATATLEITALAGPVCPVETDPPSPDCEPQPVDMAVIVVSDPDGAERARGTTGSDGTVVLEVAAGELTIVPQPVEGLLGTAAEVTVTVADDETMSVTVDYDTGIR